MSYEVFYKIEFGNGEIKEGYYVVETDNEDNALEIAGNILKHTYTKEYEILELFAAPE